MTRSSFQSNCYVRFCAYRHWSDSLQTNKPLNGSPLYPKYITFWTPDAPNFETLNGTSLEIYMLKFYGFRGNHAMTAWIATKVLVSWTEEQSVCVFYWRKLIPWTCVHLNKYKFPIWEQQRENSPNTVLKYSVISHYRAWPLTELSHKSKCPYQ